MSDDEKFAVQGRAHARAKALRSDIATASVELEQKRKLLTELGGRIESVLKDPTHLHYKEPGVPAATVLVHDLRFEHQNLLGNAATLAEDIFTKAQELKELEERIKTF
jgi:hypothetical protein